MRTVNFIAGVLLVIFVSFQNLCAGDDIAHEAKESVANLAERLFNLDENGIKNVLNLAVLESPSIKAISVYDNLSQKNFIQIAYKNGLPSKEEVSNKYLSQFDKIEEPIAYSGEDIGKLIFYFTKEKALSFSDEEKLFIAQNPIIKAHNETNWPPFNFNRNGVAQGFSIDYMNLVAQKAGFKVEYVTGEWGELLQKAYDKQIDVMLNIVKTPEREKHLLYAGSYAKNVTSIICKKGASFQNLDALAGKKASIVKGFFYEKYMKEKYPKIELVSYDSQLEALKAVIYGKVDATFGKKVIIDFLIKDNMLEELEIGGDFKHENPENDKLNIAVRNDWPQLVSIINKAMDEITIDEVQAIQKKWLGAVEKAIDFSKSEIEWLKSKPIIRYSEVNWEPMSIIENNSMTGIMGSYIKKVAEGTGLKFEFVPAKSWPEVLEMFKEGKIDMVPGVGSSAEESSLGLTTKNYDSYPMAVVARKDADLGNFSEDLSVLKGKKIAVPKFYTSYNYLVREGLEQEIIATESIEEALTLVNAGKADAFFEHLAVSLYHIDKLGFKNLHIAGLSKFQFDHRWLIREDMPHLLTIVNKIFDKIDAKERKAAYNEWVKFEITQSFDMTIVWKILGATSAVVLLIIFWNRKLSQKVEQKTAELKALLRSFDKNVIASKTDQDGFIVYASEAFCKISGYSQDELLGQKHSLIRHLDMPDEIFEDLWKTIKNGKIWCGEIENRRKDGSFYWTEAVISPECDKNGKNCGYSAIRTDITDKKEVEELSKTLELKVEERTKELEKEKIFISSVMNSQTSLVLTTDGKAIKTANKALFDFFEVENVEEFKRRYGSCICDTFDTGAPSGYLQKVMGEEKWIDHAYANRHNINKTIIKIGDKKSIFSVSVEIFDFGQEHLKTAVFSDITELEKARAAMEEMHKHTRDSIEYASLIQHSLIPENALYRNYFKDYFAIWHPKDIVGGDIYFFEEFRGGRECVLMVIDCTGHGVPGAFVTMLVKAIERQITAGIATSHEQISPAKLLSIFNKNMKHILRQENDESISNAGFDGAILHYDKESKILKFAGAQTPLFYLKDGEILTIKGDRHSIGYKKSDINYEFSDHIIEVKEGMKFYITTDGYLDQNGGEKGFPFGKKRFTELIKSCIGEEMADQQEIFLQEMRRYQGGEIRNDDITLIALEA